jgi:tetratricopeptide (TPR) repeat protein
MDLAMRVARYFRTLVLSGLITQTTIPLTACASDSAAVEFTDQSAEAPQPRGRYVDPALQQANFYDARPGQNSRMAPRPSVVPNSEKRALFSGDSFSLPKMFFGRQSQADVQTQVPAPGPTGRPTNYATQPNALPNSGRPASQQVIPAARAATAPQIRQRVASQPAAPGPNRPTQQPVINGRAVHPGVATNQNFRAPSGQQPIPLRQDANRPPMPIAVRPAQPPKPAPNSSQVSPWAAPAAASAAAAAPVNTNSAAAAPTAKPAAPAGPLSPADQLVAEAHKLSTVAKTEQDYSRIIETCRRAQASQVGPETAAFANNLTAWSFNRRGQLKAEGGHEKEAILDFDDAIRTDSTCWRAVHNRGVMLAQAGQFEKAFDDFSHTIQLNPQFAKAYSNRAALFMVANNLHAAHQDYKKAIELDANLAVAHRGCGRVCQLQGKLDDAVLHYDAAVQLAPNDAYAAACRADLLTDIGRYSDALVEYNRALQIDPKSSQANCGSAWLLATCPDSALRNPELAVERANQAIELGGEKDAISFDSLAAAQAAAGNFDEAMESIHKAIELSPVDERDAYRDRLLMYQQAKPYRIAPVDRMAQQASYTTK